MKHAAAQNPWELYLNKCIIKRYKYDGGQPIERAVRRVHGDGSVLWLKHVFAYAADRA